MSQVETQYTVYTHRLKKLTGFQIKIMSKRLCLSLYPNKVKWLQFPRPRQAMNKKDVLCFH